MTARVAFVHTVGFLADEFRNLMRAQLPEVDAFHILNESLLQDLLRGDAPAQVHRRVAEQLMLAADAGAGLMVMTCSSTSPGVDVARQMTDLPILKIDDPMAAQAVRSGQRIGLMCTATSTVAPSTGLLKFHAAQQKREIQVRPEVNAAAYQALLSGDRVTHDLLVRDSAARLASEVDVLVLAQASLAHLAGPLAEVLPCPVLASPPLLMREIARSLATA